MIIAERNCPERDSKIPLKIWVGSKNGGIATSFVTRSHLLKIKSRIFNPISSNSDFIKMFVKYVAQTKEAGLFEAEV